MGIIIGILVIFALIAAIFGRDKAQGLFYAVFGTISILVLIGITIAAPPIGLGACAFVAFYVFCSWARQDSLKRRARMEEQVRKNQSQRGNYAIGQIQGMLDFVNLQNAGLQALYTQPTVSTSTIQTPDPVRPPPQQRPVRTTAAPRTEPPLSCLAPPKLVAKPPSIPPVISVCGSCGTQLAPNQNYCGNCGKSR